MKKKILALKSKVIGNESIYSKKLKIPSIEFFDKTHISKKEPMAILNKKNLNLEIY